MRNRKKKIPPAPASADRTSFLLRRRMWGMSRGWEGVPWCQPTSLPPSWNAQSPVPGCLTMLRHPLMLRALLRGVLRCSELCTEASCSAQSVLQCSKSCIGMSCSVVTCPWGFPASGRGAAHACRCNGLRCPCIAGHPRGNSTRVHPFHPAQRGTGSSGISSLSK